MAVTEAQLGSFAALGTALGLLRGGSVNGAWLTDPLGNATEPVTPGLKTVLYDDAQRGALVSFVDEALGAPGRRTEGDAIWVPLFQETAPAVTIYVVLQERPGVVHLGIGLEHVVGAAAPSVATRLHVPIFQLDRGGSPDPVTGSGLPDWLLLGRAGGRIELSVDVTMDDGPPVPGDAFLGSAAITLAVPTAAADDLGIGLTLRDLQLPGAATPQTFELDADGLDDLGAEVFELLTGLIRAQADALDLTQPASRSFAALTGLLGLRDVAGLPPLPLADVPTAGVGAIVAWVEDVLASNAARDAWLGQLALLVDGALDPDRDAVTVTAGPLDVTVGVKVTPGNGGHPSLVPFVEVVFGTRGGAAVALAADLLQADTATGQVTAVPALRAEAVFGADAGGGALLTGDPAVGSLHLGVGLTDLRTPAFTLTLEDCTVGGRQHPLLDLSTPEAALDAANDVIDGALIAALNGLGDAGALAARLLGLDAPAGVGGIDATALLADPLAALAGYWKDLAAAPAAMSELLGALRRLLAGVPEVAVPGAGTVADPWRVDLVGASGLRVWRDGSDVLVVDLAAQVDTPVFGDLEASAALRLTLARLDLVARSAAFAAGALGRLSLHRTDGASARLDLGRVTIETESLDVDATWAPTMGFGVQLTAPGLAVVIEPTPSPTAGAIATRIDLPLPTRDAAGNLAFNPDWPDVERALAALLTELDLPVVDAIVELFGWVGTSTARLELAGLVVDARAAIEAWLADLILDCENVRSALGPVTALLSGFHMQSPLGVGSDRRPFRAPVAGERRAPGLAAWLDPGCPPPPDPVGLSLTPISGPTPPEPGDVVAVLTDASTTLADVGDLMVGRTGLAAGLQLVIDRLAGTDGLVGAPAALPTGVASVVLDGYSYDELVALGGIGALSGLAFDPPPTAVVHVGCEPTWLADRPAGTVFDASGDAVPGAIPDSGDGEWFVRLPTPAAAAAARPDRGGVGEQAARLGAILATRTADVALIGYGAAGSAAIRAAVGAPGVAQVATVGTPWAGLGIDTLRAGHGADALRLLGRMRRPDATPWPAALLALEGSPLEQARLYVTRALAAARGVDLPSAADEARRAGLEVRAVFGALAADDVARGIGVLVADGIDGRLVAARRSFDPAVVHTALHVGVDLPVIDLDVAGLLVGAGATVELVTVERGPAGDGIDLNLARGVIVDLRLGVHDGWLVGGPGAATPDIEVRWMSARVEVPFDERDGSTELVLHDARVFDVDRERWVVRATGSTVDADITAVLPEVRILLGQVVARLRAASAPLGDALVALGLSRDGGLDPDGLDRLFHDTVNSLRTAVAAAPADLAAALRTLAGATGTAAALRWTVGPATLELDLATGAIAAGLAVPAAQGIPAVDADVIVGPAGTQVTVAVGAPDADAGGLRVVGRAGMVGGLDLEWHAPGANAPRQIPVLPVADEAGLRDLTVAVLPAALAHGVIGWLRRRTGTDGRAAIDALLGSLDLLDVPRANGERLARLPLGLFTDPVGWLRRGAQPWRTDLPGSAIAVLDALAPIVAPDRTAPGWPLADELTIGYASVGGRLQITATLALETTIGSADVTTLLTGGLAIGSTGAPSAVLDATVSIDGRGLHVAVVPQTRLELVRPAPDPPIVLVPAAGGLGALVSAAGSMVVPSVLDAVMARRTDGAASIARDVGRAVHELAGALDLLAADQIAADQIDDTKLGLFAADPAAWTAARLPTLAASGLALLASALDPPGAVVHVTSPSATSTQFGFGAAAAPAVTVTLEGGATPAIVIGASVDLDGVGHLEVESLRLWAGGVQVSALIGPAELSVGGATLRPLLVVRAGVGTSGFERLLGIGLALDAAAAASVEVRWRLDASAPTLAAVDRGAGGETLGTPVVAGTRLLAVAVSMATGVVLGALDGVLTPRAVAGLQGVVFTDTANSTAVDPQAFVDLIDPAALFQRLQRLAWNLATTNPLSVTIDGLVTIALAAADVAGVAGRKRLGVSLSLPANQRYALPAGGDTKVEVEVDATWVDPVKPPGLSIFVLEGDVSAVGVVDLDLVPSVVVAGVGLRFTKTSGPLLDLGGIGIDGIAVHVYGEAAPTGIGGGVQLRLEGLAVAPAGGGGSNAVANSLMNDAGRAGAANRPAFSPSIAVQRPPAGQFGISLRAGQPPGPWWVIVQRQLGPIYVERVGFDTAEAGGQVTRIALLFDGSVSLFGLTAAVDQLSIAWIGGPLTELSSWAVDLQGLAVSADMSGISLAGGLLKTDYEGNAAYVGMLMGRFGIYGLTVFGGYTDDNGSPSFFVFGAVNGPIGGPPAFFLTGLGGGLGINRGLVIPAEMARFNEYPFIRALDPAASPPEDPMDELRKLSLYFPPQSGTFWFAAGISFTSFALVDGVAVVAVTFGNGLEINLLGLARMALPRPQAALVSIELGLLARFSTTEGVFMIKAQLTENSWLLYPEVRLTGGFAFAVWWKGPLAGQFVLTLGGYHPSFRREGYPEVPRLGLHWRVTDDIVVKGGSYFALTSEALMAGVDVEVSADFGWAWAKIGFGAHGIVYFDPFRFEVMAYARISAGVKIKTWLGTIRFSISISATVTVWGPEFSGKAKLEVGPCDFSVKFGSQDEVAPETLDWPKFVAKYLEDAGGGTARAVSSITGKGTLPAATGGAVGAPTSDGSFDRPFEVFAEFELTIVTTVPISSFDLSGGAAIPSGVRTSSGATVALGLSPMRHSDLSSTLRVRLERFDTTVGDWVSAAANLTKLAANLRAASPRPEGSNIGTDAFPIGAWGAPPALDLPVKPVPKGDVIFAANRVRLVAEPDTLTVGPEIDYYRVESGRRGLPLRATGDERTALVGVASGVAVATPTSAAQALGQARTELFVARAEELPDGVLARGGRSGVSRAAFAGDRTAPPLFGTLADGLAGRNGADPEAGRVAAPAPPGPPGVRLPFVAAYLTAGAGAVIRDAPTTVSDATIKRREAPTIDSVNARLGRALPVQLGLTALPAATAGGTVVATAVVPPTAVAGATGSYVGGPVAHRQLQGLVTGLGRAGDGPRRGRQRVAPPADAGSMVRAGDLVVLQLPDAALDVDGRAGARPQLAVGGRARLTMLRGDGAALFDDEVTDTSTNVPAGTALIGVQGDGRADVTGGLAGWHDRTRVAMLGSHGAIGPGCVLDIDGAGRPGGAGWSAAGELVGGASAVTTRFARPVRTIVVALTGDRIPRLDPLALQLGGAELATGGDDRPLDPVAVQLGSTCLIVYAVEPDPPGDDGGRPPVIVRVRAGGDWALSGVLGGDVVVGDIARLLAERGVVATAAKVLATTGPGCTVTWHPPTAPRTAVPTPAAGPEPITSREALR